MTKLTTDRIEKRIVLAAPRSRVWRALTDYREFGAWFGVVLDAPFRAGETVTGTITYKGSLLAVTFAVQKLEPERLFSYRWHPYAVDPSVDYSAEPMTLVVFELAETTTGTLLTVTESGFDRIPLARRAEAFRMNDGGWTAQIESIRKHVDEKK